MKEHKKGIKRNLSLRWRKRLKKATHQGRGRIMHAFERY